MPYNKAQINEAIGSVQLDTLVVVLYSEYLKTSNLVISPRKLSFYDQLTDGAEIVNLG